MFGCAARLKPVSEPFRHCAVPKAENWFATPYRHGGKDKAEAFFSKE